MSVNVTFKNVVYSVPTIAGEDGWETTLSTYLQALASGAAVNSIVQQTCRVATTSPVTVSATTDFAVVTKLSSPGAVTVNLPAGVTGQMFCIVDGTGDAAVNNITVNANGGELINGQSSFVIDADRGHVTVHWNGTEWTVVSERKGLGGRQTFSSSGSWVCPSNVTTAFLVGRGGSGGGAGGSPTSPGGGGGGVQGRPTVVTVVPGVTYTVTIGAGGAGGAAGVDGGSGGDSTFGSLATFRGGEGGKADGTGGDGDLSIVNGGGYSGNAGGASQSAVGGLSPGDNPAQGGGGGGAGNGAGGGGGTFPNGNGSAGTSGGGGGGGSAGTPGGAGGSGTAGEITVVWIG